jgi:uncharacterized protein with GYD domain
MKAVNPYQNPMERQLNSLPVETNIYTFYSEGLIMATFVMTGKYTPQALADLSAKRTKDALSIIKKNKGEVQLMYATLGQNDLLFVLDFPGLKEALKTSVALAKLTGIGFTTSAAVPVNVFDKLMSDS